MTEEVFVLTGGNKLGNISDSSIASARSGTTLFSDNQWLDLGCGHETFRMQTRLYPIMFLGVPDFAFLPSK